MPFFTRMDVRVELLAGTASNACWMVVKLPDPSLATTYWKHVVVGVLVGVLVAVRVGVLVRPGVSVRVGVAAAPPQLMLVSVAPA